MVSKTSSSLFYPSVGTFIDNGALQLVEVLSSIRGPGGSSGVVYRAVDTRQPAGQKTYAVRCLYVSFIPAVAQYQRQVRMQGIKLHQLASAHPGVVSLDRVVDQRNQLYIVMDYAPDHNLSTQIFQKHRYLGNNATIKNVFLQLIDAVEHFHSIGISHLDLRPTNIVCFEEGLRVAITNFGLATADLLSEEFFKGSIGYMGPECHGAEFAPTGKYSPRFNDVWSLGIILLNMITGRAPWMFATRDKPTFRAYLSDPLGYLPTVFPISSEVNDILVGMLRVDWHIRSTLHEVRRAVEKITNFYSDGVIFQGGKAYYRSQLENIQTGPKFSYTEQYPCPDNLSFYSNDSTLSVGTSYSSTHSSIATLSNGLYYKRHAVSDDSITLVE